MSDTQAYGWLTEVPAFKEWLANQATMKGHALDVSFTQAADGTWGAQIVKGEEVVGGPLSVEGQPSREACELAMREALSKRAGAHLG